MFFSAILWNPDDTLFKIGFLQIKYYNLMWILAFVVGFYVMKWVFKKENKTLEKLDSLFVYGVVSIMLGARLGHVFFYDWAYYKNHLLEILLPIRESDDGSLFGFINGYEFTGFTGLASHGAAIAGIIGLFLFSRKYKDMGVLWLLDRVTMASLVGAGLVRVGNFFNSEINGNIVDKTFAFAVKFVRDSDDMPAYRALQLTKEKTASAAYKAIENNPDFASVLDSIPYRHPVQLYEAICYFLIFIAMFFIYKNTNKKAKAGFLFGFWMVSMWTVRFVLEYYKKSQGGFEETWGTFSTGQWLSIPFVLLGLYLMFRPSDTNHA
ncbi:prolipoprotein diacylglyceryl transferase [Flagellimonas sp. DF-77]|uniref:prolipoprotein diacylglyceryl transferase n=1 Tax=Flagellimonas algarum TaxID=3230298 RepID=UPI003398DC54